MTDNEKLEYVIYLWSKMSERGEPADSARSRGLRDIIYKGTYHEYDDSNFDYLLSYYFGDYYKDLDSSIGTIKTYIRNRKINDIIKNP